MDELRSAVRRAVVEPGPLSLPSLAAAARRDRRPDRRPEPRSCVAALLSAEHSTRVRAQLQNIAGGRQTEVSAAQRRVDEERAKEPPPPLEGSLADEPKPQRPVVDDEEEDV